MVAKFSIATTENYKDGNGEWQNQTEWHDIVAWRERAEQAIANFKKGMTVYVEGKLTHRKYTDQNNIERYRTEVVASYMRLIKKPDGQGSNYFPTAEHEPSVSANKGTSGNGNNASASASATGSFPTVEPVQAEAPPVAADDLPF